MASALKKFDWNEREPDRERRNEQAAANLKEMHRDQKMISIHPFLSGWLRVELEKVKNYRDPTELLKEALLAEKFTNLDGEIEFFYYTGAGEEPIAATKDLLETWLDDDICGLNTLLEFSWSTQSVLANWLRTDLNIEPPTSWALIDTIDENLSAIRAGDSFIVEVRAIHKEIEALAKQFQREKDQPEIEPDDKPEIESGKGDDLPSGAKFKKNSPGVNRAIEAINNLWGGHIPETLGADQRNDSINKWLKDNGKRTIHTKSIQRAIVFLSEQ